MYKPKCRINIQQFLGNLNQRFYDIYPTHTAVFYNETQGQFLIVDVK